MATKPPTTQPFAFEPALRELEAITAQFEGGEIDLDKSLAQFERGLELVEALKAHLQGVENQVARIKAKHSVPPPTDDLVTTDQLPF